MLEAKFSMVDEMVSWFRKVNKEYGLGFTEPSLKKLEKSAPKIDPTFNSIPVIHWTLESPGHSLLMRYRILRSFHSRTGASLHLKGVLDGDERSLQNLKLRNETFEPWLLGWQNLTLTQSGNDNLDLACFGAFDIVMQHEGYALAMNGVHTPFLTAAGLWLESEHCTFVPAIVLTHDGELSIRVRPAGTEIMPRYVRPRVIRSATWSIRSPYNMGRQG